MTVLALDLATITGWAYGEPGSVPVHGTKRFAAPGASHEAIFANAMHWTKGLLADKHVTTVVWEAPMVTTFARGNTTSNTTTVLYGLPAVIGAVVYSAGIYDIRKAETKLVRNYFIGSNPKRAKAKSLVMQMCRANGWEVADDNEADALATWDYMCALLEPKLAMRPTPLFGQMRPGADRP